jgi:hypothetical protein
MIDNKLTKFLSTYVVVKHEEALLGLVVLIGDDVEVEVGRGCRLFPCSNVQDQLSNKVLGPVLGSVSKNVLEELLFELRR